MGLWLLARREPVPDHVLFAVLGVWIPIVIIGFFEWNVPLRYTAAQIFPLLLAAFAAMQWLVGGPRWLTRVALARRARDGGVHRCGESDGLCARR